MAAGVVGFVDADGAVANLLIAARNALDAMVARLAARDYSGAAMQLGPALGAIANAATAVGGTSFLNLLLTKIDWAAAQPAGLAKQLGLAGVRSQAVAGRRHTRLLGSPYRAVR